MKPKLILLLTIMALVVPTASWAQQPDFGIGTTYPISDPSAVSGDIVSLSPDGLSLTLSKNAYDDRMHGVLVDKPAMVFRSTDDIPVVRTGNALVNVTTLNGPIKAGDFITSSEIKGKGMRAEELSGYVVGIALEPLAEDGGTQIEYLGKKLRSTSILVAIGIGPATPVLRAGGGLLGTFRQIAGAFLFNFRVSRQFERVIRVILAALIAVVTIWITFNRFGKNVTRGIEAIGRNPLAKVSIQSMIVINGVLIGIVGVAGILLALAVLTL